MSIWDPSPARKGLTGLPWDASYYDGPAPWDTGQPQPAIVRLAVLGVDVAETALAIAREKAADRGIEVEFAAADAFQLERLGRRFKTVLDCRLFVSV